MASVIAAVIQLKDQFSATLKNVNKNLSEFQRQAAYAGKNITKTGKNMQAVGGSLTKSVTVPIVAVGAALLALGDNFEKSYNTIRTTTGKTGKALEGLESDFRSTLGQTGASMADTSKVIADLSARTGLAGKPLQDLSLQMLRLSSITKSDLNTLIPATTRMFQDAGIKQEDYSKALDYTFKVSQNTGIGVGRLQELMTQFGGPLRQMGFDWQTSAAMLGKFEKEGVNTELVVGSLRIALGKMAAKGVADPATALQSMITQIKNAGSAGKANALALSMFGAKAGPDMAAAIREGRMDLSGLLKTLKDSPETINKAAADTATFATKMAKMKNQMAVAFEPVGMKLVDSVEKLIPSIQKAGEFVATYAKKLADMSPKQQEMILKFLLIAAAVGPVITIIGKMTVGIGNTVKAFTGAFKAISNAGGILKFLITPGSLVVLVIIAIAVAAFLLIKYWTPISTFFKKVWNDILGVTQKVWAIIGPTIMGAVNKIVAFWKEIWPQLYKVLAVVFKVIAAVIGPYIAIVYVIIKAWLGFIIGFWKSAWNLLKDSLKIVWDLIGGVIKIAWDYISGIIKIGLDILTGNWSKAWTDIKLLVINLWNDIKSIFANLGTDALKWGSDFIAGFINGIKGAASGVFDAVSGIVNTVKGIFNVPVTVTKTIASSAKSRGYATGTTYATPGEHWVGEEGPEKVTFKGGETVKNAKDSKKDSSGSPFTINMYGLTIREEADIDKVATALARKLDEAATNTP